jgi:hypothetical protein
MRSVCGRWLRCASCGVHFVGQQKECHRWRFFVVGARYRAALRGEQNEKGDMNEQYDNDRYNAHPMPSRASRP